MILELAAIELVVDREACESGSAAGDCGKVLEGYGPHKAEKSISRLEWFAANCGMGALGLQAGRVASVM